MDILGDNLLTYLTDGPRMHIRQNVYQLLNASMDEVYVYYVTPLAHLSSILSDGGIKCREMIEDRTSDLSSQGVQQRRRISLELAKKTSSNKEVIVRRVHACINFYWNPLNWTFQAFQRNALVFNPEEPDSLYGIVCLIEVKLKSLFQSNTVYWCASNKNLAVDRRVTTEPFETFKWSKVYCLSNDQESNQYRSAEFIAYQQNPKLYSSDPIPAQFINRIILPAQHREKAQKMLPFNQNLIYPSSNEVVFPSTQTSLRGDKAFIISIGKLSSYGLPVKKFCELLNTFGNYSQILGCHLSAAWFKKIDIAHSHLHGIAHVTRVMFWANILSYLTKADNQTQVTAQYAAFIHDLCRQHQGEDSEHGLEAVKKFSNWLIQTKIVIPDHLLDSCKNAVIYHCKADDECHNKDIIWQILKDADSLERGRFAPPDDKNTMSAPGCNVNLLRIDISPKLKRELAWSAYRLASITHHTSWSEDSYEDIKKTIACSLKACLRNNILNQSEHQLATEMLMNIDL